MPRYEFNPDAVNAVIPVLPKGDYEFIIGEPKSFARTNQRGGDSFGVRFPIVVAETTNGIKKGTRIFFSTYHQTDGAQAVAKQFLMAALGYKRTEEDESRFNEDFRGKDWGFNTEDGSVGDMWLEVKGKRIVGSLDVGVNEQTSQPQQQFPVGCWSPLS